MEKSRLLSWKLFFSSSAIRVYIITDINFNHLFNEVVLSAGKLSFYLILTNFRLSLSPIESFLLMRHSCYSSMIFLKITSSYVLTLNKSWSSIYCLRMTRSSVDFSHVCLTETQQMVHGSQFEYALQRLINFRKAQQLPNNRNCSFFEQLVKVKKISRYTFSRLVTVIWYLKIENTSYTCQKGHDLRFFFEESFVMIHEYFTSHTYFPSHDLSWWVNCVGWAK